MMQKSSGISENLRYGPVIPSGNYSPTSIPQTSRGFIAGMTGSGKTTLAKILISPFPHLLVIDPKHEFETYQEFVIVNEPEELEERGDYAAETHKAIIYRPSIENLQTARIDIVYKWAFRREGTFIYTDEVYAVIPNANSYPTGLRAIMTQGRSRGVGMLNCSQRPAYIPRFLISESDQFWKFRLNLKDDDVAMAETMGREVLQPHKDRHSYYYKSVFDEGKSEQYLLHL